MKKDNNFVICTRCNQGQVVWDDGQIKLCQECFDECEHPVKIGFLSVLLFAISILAFTLFLCLNMP